MLRRDYLVRMIEEMTDMIATVFNLKQQKKYTEALWELDEQYKKQFRLNGTLVNSLSLKDLIEVFRMGDKIEADKLQSLARLMKEEGGIYLEQNKEDEAVIRYMKALHLFMYASFHGADRELWNIDREVQELRTAVKGYQLPVETEQLLMSYEEREGRFDSAEDSLYRLLKSGTTGIGEGTAFYERLLNLEDEKLEQGNLPREEVEEGLAELRRRAEAPDEE
ncbi:hypothetical protein DCC85_18555 [Paenibacillus sp. CAA11]|uniref:DUF6483 family protein n=1 Tax=Paenibacillus sp. CAA11 TaxID=1532905 RepID=UPI000D34DEB6|nr:DUF6483 family protein [Paenibacillus sp. CAA11]AWB47043.1 hypothetical protein DCC85_18555 [Paenibacillus sp. CAA11]